ncbi:MAG TPA: ThuA domain-containing protein [Polyangiaceae bacterium]
MIRFGFLSRGLLPVALAGACSSAQSGGAGAGAGGAAVATGGTAGAPASGAGAGNVAGANVAGANLGGSSQTGGAASAGLGAGGAGAAGAPAGGSSGAAGSSSAGAASAGSAGAAGNNKILIYSKTTGFRHDSIPAAAMAITKAASAFGLVCEQSEDPAKFAAAQLSQYAAVVLLATTGEPFGSPGTTQVQTLIEYVRAGHGLVGIEDCNNAYNANAPYISLIGGEFTGHPPFGMDTCYSDGTHPTVAKLPPVLLVTDEIYQFTMQNPANQVVLRCGSDKRPISWVRSEGAGRVFYTALGHADASWTMPPLVDGHVIPGLLWSLGR